MFTGIIEEVAKVRNITYKGDNASIDVACKLVVADVKVGDSIAVNGVCLTVTTFNGGGFTADISKETLSRTSLREAKPGTVINLERSMLAGGRFGGHIVQGHVDGVGTIAEIKSDGKFWNLRVNTPENIRKYISEKGSITVDGISLTVAKDLITCFTVAIIPHSFENTNLCTLSPGSTVNLEVDVIARYIEKLLDSSEKESRLSMLLKEF